MRVQPQARQVYSLTQIIRDHLQRLQRDTGVTMNVFVCDVRQHYEERYLPHSRFIEWSQYSDPYIRMTRDAEKFTRWLGSDTLKQLPIDLLESIIAAFPADRRFRLQIELASRQGMLAIQMPNGNASDDGLFLGKMAKETGEAMIAISALLDDGVIDSRDKAKAEQAVNELEEAIAVIAAMKAHIERKALGKEHCMVAGKDVLNTYKTDPTKID
jgi:hypothetical protein